MTTTPIPDLEPPRLETIRPMLIAGLAARYDCQATAGIPNQWQQFGARWAEIPKQTGNIAYGVCSNFDGDGNFDYLCGVEVADATNLPDGMTSIQVPAHKYAIFTHRGHVAGIRATFAAIWNRWMPESGHQPANAPTLEVYGPEFNPQTGLGGFEIRIPIQE